MDYKAVFSNDSFLDINHGRLIPIENVNKVLFSNSKQFPIIGKIVLLNSGMIFEINNKFYLNLNKFSDYIELIKCNKNNFKDCFPYNYYKFFDKDNKFINLMEQIDGYLHYLNNKNDNFSNTIKYILTKKNILNSELVSEIDNTYCLKFDKKGKPLYITISEEIKLDNESLYLKHKQTILQEEPEKFLIINLERVTGDENFASSIVKSYLHKNEFNTLINDISNLILWKNISAKDKYIEKFINKYIHLVEVNPDGIFTNFEGFNKFLLNIQENDVQQWEVKEQINELYFKITNELIRSFEILYFENLLILN